MDTPETTTVILIGKADMTDARSVGELHADVERSLRRARRRLVLDLSPVAGTDTKLMALLVVAARRARQQALRLEIRASAAVRSWISVYGLDALLDGTRGAGSARARAESAE